MLIFDRIVAIIDGSETAHYTIEASIAVAEANGSSLTFCVALDPSLSEDGIGGLGFTDLATQMNQRILDSALAQARRHGIDRVAGKIFIGDAAPGVVALAQEQHAACIVLAMKPRMYALRPFILSLAEEVLRQTSIPLYVVRRPLHDRVSRRILVPVVDDDLSQLAAQYATRLAASSESTLVFCSIEGETGPVAGTHALRRARAFAAAARVRAEQLLLPITNGVPNAIVHSAEIQACDSIVMASHVRQGLPRLIEGSVTEAVLYASDVPVIIVRGALGAKLSRSTRTEPQHS